MTEQVNIIGTEDHTFLIDTRVLQQKINESGGLEDHNDSIIVKNCARASCVYNYNAGKWLLKHALREYKWRRQWEVINGHFHGWHECPSCGFGVADTAWNDSYNFCPCCGMPLDTKEELNENRMEDG